MYKTPREEKAELLEKLIILVFGVGILLILGMLVFHFSEGWSYKDSLYFSAVSLTSRGVTPNYPTNWISIIFSVIYMLIGVAFIIYSLSSLIAYYISYYNKNLGKRVHEVVTWFKDKQKERKKKNWINIKH